VKRMVVINSSTHWWEWRSVTLFGSGVSVADVMLEKFTLDCKEAE
jgi:hypothetical protein